jgi:hypothetical protein
MSHGDIGIGVIGYGYWGPNLVRNFANADSAQIITVSDLDPARLTICKRMHPGVTTSTEARDLFRDSRIDAVSSRHPSIHTMTWRSRLSKLVNMPSCAGNLAPY